MVNIDNLFKMISEKGITQSKLAENTSISTGNISDWKKGKSMPSAVKLDELATYFGCSVDYLLGRTDEPNGYNNNISNIDTTVNGTQANIINNDRNNDNFDEVKNILNHLSTATRFRAIADILDLLEEKYIKSEIEAEPKINITYSKIYADEGGVTKKETPAGLPKISDFFDD